MSKTSRLLIVACATVLLSMPARAQYIMEFAQTYNAPMSNFISATVMNNAAMIDAATPRQTLRASAAAQTGRSARELAQRFPAEQRAKMEQLFTQSYDIYRKLEAKFAWEPDDLAGALAAFVVGNYMAYTDANVADEHYVAVAAQLRRNLAAADGLKGLKPQDLRLMYEQSAMVGAFMALTQMSQAQHAQPAAVKANIRDTARANLEQVLGFDPARLQIGAHGLRAR